MTPLHHFRARQKLLNGQLPVTASLGPAPTTTVPSSSSSLLAPAPYRPSISNTSTNQKQRWGPQGQIALQASSSSADKADITRLQAVIANMTGGPEQYACTGMPSAHDPYAHVSLLSSARPRPFYCCLHGYNNIYDGTTCNVMRANPEYTAYQKNAQSADGTGGNPFFCIQLCL